MDDVEVKTVDDVADQDDADKYVLVRRSTIVGLRATIDALKTAIVEEEGEAHLEGHVDSTSPRAALSCDRLRSILEGAPAEARAVLAQRLEDAEIRVAVLRRERAKLLRSMAKLARATLKIVAMA
jgi:hypothetical protein